MIGINNWKDWNTQEYLEDLIRLQYPAAKVNDIVPFQKTIEAGGTLAINDNLFFVKITPFFHVGDTPNGWWVYSPNLIGGTSSGASTDRATTSDFILTPQITSFGDVTLIVVGWKITLDNNIQDIGAGEEAPVIAPVVGAISVPAVFYSTGTAADNKANSTGFKAVSFLANVIGGDAVWVQTGVDTPIKLAANTNVSITDFPAVLPFVLKITGTIDANDTVLGDQFVTTVYGELMHFRVTNRLYRSVPDEFWVMVDQLQIGSEYQAMLEVDGINIGEIILTAEADAETWVFEGITTNPMLVAGACKIYINPFYNGIQADFSFIDDPNPIPPTP